MGDVVLGIETSCDETAVAVVERAAVVRSSVVSSQVEQHARFGGVVPEIAGRAHVQELVPVLAEALATAGVEGPDVEVVAATTGPGLVGSLLVGVSAAKALSLVWGVPFVSVNHLEAHLYASFLEEPDLELPLVVLLVSGGHTMLVLMEDHGRYRLLGSTLDDAAGEAFDKVARVLKLPYPGGPHIDCAAADGDSTAIHFPRGLTSRKDLERHRFDYSFSGLKTAVVRLVEECERAGRSAPIANVAASFNVAVADVLTCKAIDACQEYGVYDLQIGGGVMANSRLRTMAQKRCDTAGISLRVPRVRLCTDNGAMVAALGSQMVQRGILPSPLDLPANSSMPVDQIKTS